MKYNKIVGSVEISLDTDRLDRNIKEAQKKLDMQVLSDSNLYIPQQQGSLMGTGRIIKDGEISWDTPYAHYQYEGELYLAANGSSWAHKHEQKYPTGIPLEQSKKINPLATDHWFEKAKEQNLEQWLDTVKRTAGKD